MRILIVGGGGREHALAWRLAKSASVKAVFASPGNPGIAQIGACVPAPAAIAGYPDIAEHVSADLTVVGPETPLVGGIVDRFRERGLKIIGPTAAAARLEGSKCFAKEFFRRAGIPTARSSDNIKDFSFPVVIKADGLAAGKGVVIAHDENEARQAIARLGPTVVIEEFLEGEEVSFIGLCEGRCIFPFTPTQDHKRVFDGDRGPNTGGMGAYCDSRTLTAQQSGEVMERIMLPALRQMGKEGAPFTGFLYAGLMITADGPKVLEFNVRLGDPETQALMYSFEGDLADLLIGGVSAARSAGTATAAPPGRPAVCVVLSAEGYPDSPKLGDRISGIEEAEATGAVVFQAGTKKRDDALVTSGGRVLGVTADGDTLPSAISNAYRAVEKIQFAGMHYRKDIGARGLKRW
jgi:phosphoribosylamine---glycine ligase